MNNFIKMATNFVTELVERGATEEELWAAVRFSADLIDISKKYDISGMTSKYNIGYFDGMNVPGIKTKEHRIKTPDEIYEQMKVTQVSPVEEEYYRQMDKAVTALGTYKDPNLTWTAEELGIKKEKNVNGTET